MNKLLSKNDLIKINKITQLLCDFQDEKLEKVEAYILGLAGRESDKKEQQVC